MIITSRSTDVQNQRELARPLAVSAIGLGKAIDDRRILQDINLAIAPGRCVALLGANGAGKSTLLHILSTLTRPTAGELVLFGRPDGDRNALRSRIGMIGHQPMIYRDLSAIENLVLFGKLYGLCDAHERANAMLGRVDLADRSHDRVRQFSRGMTQRLAIARALMHDPELLLADEPFAGLDLPSTRAVERLLTHLVAEGKTVIFSNHDVPQTLSLAQRVIVLRGGRIVLDASAERTSVAAVMHQIMSEGRAS